MKACSYCGKPNADEQVFCTGCGTQFVTEETPEEAPSQSRSTPKLSESSHSPIQDAEPLDVSAIDMGFSMVEGFSRPNWSGIRKCIEELFPEANQPQAWLQIARQWLTQLCEDLGGNYFCYESDRFLLLSAETDEHSQAILQIAEQALTGLRERLGNVAWQWRHGKAVILVFNEEDDYYSYISFFGEDGPNILSGGAFIKKDYAHLALPFKSVSVTKLVIVHELTHNCLRHLPIPTWLNEGVCRRMERENVPRRGSVVLDRELAGEHHAWWNETNIQDFWAGRSYYNPGEASKLSYSLGEILVEVLSEDWGSFLDFLAHADYRDAGQDAALKFLGRSLGDAVAGFLGPGEWRPNRKAIAERMVAQKDKSASEASQM